MKEKTAVIVYKEPKRQQFSEDDSKEKMMELANTMMGIPGIEIASMSHYVSGPILFFFYSKDPQGLFFLARCCDRRYFKHGDKWVIDVSVGDSFDGEHLPTTYTLRREIKKREETVSDACREIGDLIENINYHFNHENFIEGYSIDREKFEYKFSGDFITVKE